MIDIVDIENIINDSRRPMGDFIKSQGFVTAILDHRTFIFSLPRGSGKTLLLVQLEKDYNSIVFVPRDIMGKGVYKNFYTSFQSYSSKMRGYRHGKNIDCILFDEVPDTLGILRELLPTIISNVDVDKFFVLSMRTG